MKKVFFKQNNYLHKNNFTLKLKKEIKMMLDQYFNEEIAVPVDFDVFDKEISDLILKILDDLDTENKNCKRKKIYKVKTIKTSLWKSKKLIK